MIHFDFSFRGLVLAAAALVTPVLLSGCASTSTTRHAAPVDPRTPAVYRSGEQPASWSDMVAACSGADVILVGENHGHPVGLPAAAALWEDVLGQSKSAALALEFFERDEQVALDDYLRGLTDEAAFRAAAHRSESNYPAGHRAMVEGAKAAERPVVAANAPRRYVRVARTDGYGKLEALLPEQKRLFRVPDKLPEGAYRDAFNRVMTSDADHGEAKTDAPKDFSHLDGPFRSQSLWDWTMADSVAAAVREQNRPVLLVVGRFHIDHEGGTVLALRQLAPGARIVTVSFVNADAPAAEDKGRADFVVFVGPAPEDD